MDSNGGKVRLDFHGLPSLGRGNTFHFHTNYWGYSNSPHRSLNPFRFGPTTKRGRGKSALGKDSK